MGMMAIAGPQSDEREDAMKKVLIVDDDRDMCEAIDSVLSGKYETRIANAKEEALDLVENFIPDLVILDVMMETISMGFELAREIKSGTLPPRILMLTSVDWKAGIDFKPEAGNPDWLPADDYLTKPLRPKELLEKVSTLLL